MFNALTENLLGCICILIWNKSGEQNLNTQQQALRLIIIIIIIIVCIHVDTTSYKDYFMQVTTQIYVQNPVSK